MAFSHKAPHHGPPPPPAPFPALPPLFFAIVVVEKALTANKLPRFFPLRRVNLKVHEQFPHHCTGGTQKSPKALSRKVSSRFSPSLHAVTPELGIGAEALSDALPWMGETKLSPC